MVQATSTCLSLPESEVEVKKKALKNCEACGGIGFYLERKYFGSGKITKPIWKDCECLDRPSIRASAKRKEDSK
jgi:hypothetical protein